MELQYATNAKAIRDHRRRYVALSLAALVPFYGFRDELWTVLNRRRHRARLAVASRDGRRGLRRWRLRAPRYRVECGNRP